MRIFLVGCWSCRSVLFQSEGRAWLDDLMPARRSPACGTKTYPGHEAQLGVTYVSGLSVTYVFGPYLYSNNFDNLTRLKVGQNWDLSPVQGLSRHTPFPVRNPVEMRSSIHSAPRVSDTSTARQSPEDSVARTGTTDAAG